MLLDPKLQKVSMDTPQECPWNLDMMMETFTHVYGYTLILPVNPQDFYGNKKDFYGNKIDSYGNKMDFDGN